MRKKNKLYTANQWNQPLFAQGVDRENHNIFDGLDSSRLNSFFTNQNSNVTGSLVDNPYNFNYLNNVNANSFGSLAQQPSSSSFNTKLKVSPSSTTSTNSSSNSNLAGYMGALSNLGDLGASEKYKRGMWDIADPLYHLAGGKESAIGNGLSDAGVATFKAGAQSGNGILMLAGGIAKGVGSAWNALAGTKWNKENISNIENNTYAINRASSAFSGANTTSDLINAAGTMTGGYNFNMKDIGSKGPLAGHKLDRKYKGLQYQQDTALAKLDHSVATAANRVDRNVDDIAMANVAAFGGPLDTSNSGAINYEFMSNYLTAKNRAVDVKDKVNSNIFGSLQASPYGVFALGGDMQTNSSDFTTGLAHIDEGGSHESNPYEGVQVGISRENGNPNLVEEGETIFDDYVYSTRIKVDAQTKKKFHLGKSANMTFAELSKKLEKESLERPNDAISQAALSKQMHALADEQERQKAEMEAQEEQAAQEEFNNLPPEQQQAIMQQVAMEQQVAAQQQAQQQQEAQAMQEQQLAEQQGQMEPQQMVDEQMVQQQAEQPQMEEQQINACGGKMNRFDLGGDIKKGIYKALGFYTDPDFEEWRKKNNLDEVTDWENISKNAAFMDALRKSSPALSNALSHNYDFGAYKPSEVSPYDLSTFNGVLDKYTASRNQGNVDGNYAVDGEFNLGNYKTIEDLENSDNYKAYTNYLVNLANRAKGIKFKDPNADGKWKDYKDIEWGDDSHKLSEADYNALNTLWHHTVGTSTKSEGKPVPLFTTDDNGLFSIADNAGDLITRYRTDHKGGIFHLTPEALKRNREIKSFEVDDKGNVHEIYTQVPEGWSNVGNYKWQDKDNDYLYNYYKRPGDPNANTNDTPTDKKMVPKHKAEWPRYLGMFGPIAALAMQRAGIGKPEWVDWQKSLDIAEGATAYAGFKPIPNYLRYQPMDIWAEQNRMNANSRATDRAITNSASPMASKEAGLLANAYTDQNASGNLFRQALEYNDALRQKTAEFNRGTDQYNAEAYNTTSRTNAEIANNQRRLRAQMYADFANARLNANSAWNQSIYGNVNNLFKGISDWGKENAQHNMIADMAADGLFGTMKDQYISRDYLEEEKNKNKVVKAAKGGKLKRKKGLTF